MDIGSVNDSIWRLPIDGMLGLFAVFGYGQNVSEKFIIFFPLILFTCLSCYLLLNELVSHRGASILGALVFGFSSYFLAIGTQGQILITVAASFCVMGAWQFCRFINRGKAYHLVASAMLLSLGGFYDIRIPYLFAYVILLLSIYFKLNGVKLKKLIVGLGGLTALLIAINFFWLLLIPIVGVDPQHSVLGRPLFGNQYWNLLSALSLQHPFWTGGSLSWFTLAKPIIPLFIIPFICFGCVAVFRRSKLVITFTVLAATGIFLGKQVDHPLSWIYPLLYAHFPGFDAFREATKFYIYIALGYAGLVAYAFANLSKRFQVLILAGVVIVTTLNVFPIASGEIKSLYIPRQLPNDYKIAASLISGNPNDSFYRTYWVPIYPNWFFGSLNHPEINAIRLLGDMTDLNLGDLPNPTQAQTLTSFLSQSYAQEMLSTFSVKYIVVPVRDEANDNDVFNAYGDDRTFYTEFLNKIDWMKKINAHTSQLAIYENKGLSSYLSAGDSLLSFSQVNDLDTLYTFATQQFGSQLLKFSTSVSQAPSTGVYDLFGDLSGGRTNSGAISAQRVPQSGPTTTRETLYYNSNLATFRYNLINGNINLYENALDGLLVNGQPLLPQAPERLVGSVSVDQTSPYYIDSGNNLYPVTGAGSLGRINQDPKVFAASGGNLIENPSLESGLWQNKVSDCNNYDSKPQIGMSLSRQSTHGSYSLQLSADRHTACTGPAAVPVSPGASYALAFDYKVAGGQLAGYILTFNDPGETVVKNYLQSGDNQWRTFRRKVDVPVGASTVKLQVLGIPDSQHRQTATTNYDNFSFRALSLKLDPQIDTSPNYAQQTLVGNENISYEDPAHRANNLIPDGSLEDGLWQAKVRDCNDYDSQPKIGMKLSNLASAGKHSLELEAARHTACTGPNPISVNQGSTYSFSFDYLSRNATQAAYYVEFNDPARTVYTDQLNIANKGWEHFSKILKAPPGATKMSLTVYSYPKDAQSENVATFYDNFQLVQVPDIENAFYLVKKPVATLSPPKQVSYKSESPTKKIVQITGASTPFYLNMSEAYNPKWQLEMNNAKVQGLWNNLLPWVHADAVPANDHYKLDDFANGWYVDVNKLCKQEQLCQKNPDGSYNLSMEIEFTPQRWFYVGSIVSGLTLLGCLGFLGMVGIRRMRRRLAN